MKTLLANQIHIGPLHVQNTYIEIAIEPTKTKVLFQSSSKIELSFQSMFVKSLEYRDSSNSTVFGELKNPRYLNPF